MMHYVLHIFPIIAGVVNGKCKEPKDSNMNVFILIFVPMKNYNLRTLFVNTGVLSQEPKA